ncbi:hypothetical protein H6S82_20485 [Planktothrix sp. FACHB-1355]|uniref:Intein C-terminal splicing domain-containing protein n=1 Tax=Aerosakkonema funiforme FACHB-1375 TaxID=2949571 RepID=A0A926ZJ35_9CYAN|nr:MULTISPECIES: hypothetical protein [Oscillatoriales]MBD2182466.1 hypothetical protein [Aerosakkonema funiforme FACHB-1375]MBD3561206.1 hypothetical protein [Planktothrix sp. FACHB-1355]
MRHRNYVPKKFYCGRSSGHNIYNFEVEGFHTYFVSDLGVLVHNTCDRDINRIGGGSPDNLKLKPAEQKLNPPGISVLKGGSPAEAAQQMKKAFPNAAGLHEAAKVVGSTNEALIRSAGFDIMPAPTKKFPNHHRITHPNGGKGFNDENLSRLSDVFTDTRLED